MKDQRLKPAIWLRKVEQAASRSHLGGLPSLPDNIEWPTQPVTNVPLHFIGQIDLESLPITPLPGGDDGETLPSHGMLFFFADFSNLNRASTYGSVRVVFATSAENARAPSGDLPPMDFMGFDFLPPAGDQRLFPIVHLVAHVVDTCPDDYRRAKRTISRSQMFGVPNVTTDAGKTAIGEGHCLLMEFDDDSLGELLTYEGLVQVWIRPDDLKARRFDRATGGLSVLQPFEV